MSDFAGDFVLQLEQSAPATASQPSRLDPPPAGSKRRRPVRIPNFEALTVQNPGRHPVVAACIQAAALAFVEGYQSGQPRDFCILLAEAAYTAAMPDPVGEWDTRNFIACVAYGVHAHLIPQDEASRLLYAAQIALTGLSQKGKS